VEQRFTNPSVFTPLQPRRYFFPALTSNHLTFQIHRRISFRDPMTSVMHSPERTELLSDQPKVKAPVREREIMPTKKPIKKSEKIVRIVFAVVLLVVVSQSDCVRASWASHRIRRGMTVNEALQISGDWTWGHAYSERPTPEPGVGLSFSPHSIHLQGKDELQDVTSREELAQVIEQQMNGHAWSMSFTYLWPLRASFLVFFDAQGRVERVSGIGGPNW